MVVTCCDERTLEQSRVALRKLRERFDHAQGRIVGDSFRFHLRDGRVRNFIAKRTVLDRVRAYRDRVDDIFAVACVNGDGKILRVRFIHDRAEHIQIPSG